MDPVQATLITYIPVGMILAATLALGVGQMVIGTILGPKKPSKVKLEPYECGIESVGPANIRMNVKFSLVALLFLIFDIEGIFIFLWAVAFQTGSFSDPGLSFKMFAFLEMMVFFAILLAGYLYAWRKGALDWT